MRAISYVCFFFFFLVVSAVRVCMRIYHRKFHLIYTNAETVTDDVFHRNEPEPECTPCFELNDRNSINIATGIPFFTVIYLFFFCHLFCCTIRLDDVAFFLLSIPEFLSLHNHLFYSFVVCRPLLGRIRSIFFKSLMNFCGKRL